MDDVDVVRFIVRSSVMDIASRCSSSDVDLVHPSEENSTPCHDHESAVSTGEHARTKDVAMHWLLIASKCLAWSSLAQAQIIW